MYCKVQFFLDAADGAIMAARFLLYFFDNYVFLILHQF
jgi:hypothetical protein